MARWTRERRSWRHRCWRPRREAWRLSTALEQSWDGEWYRRGYDDDGTPLGSTQNDECKIDSIAQSWAVLSGAVPLRFAERAMDAVRTSLVSRGSQILLLLSPPFDRSTQDPGYIKGYPPGVRENGGQYTHAAVWIVMALARGLESILGLRRRGATFAVDPCVPASWPEYDIVWQFRSTRYEIAVSNPDRRCRGVASATLDGTPVNAAAIPLVDDGRTHQVRVVLGDPARRSR